MMSYEFVFPEVLLLYADTLYHMLLVFERIPFLLVGCLIIELGIWFSGFALGRPVTLMLLLD